MELSEKSEVSPRVTGINTLLTSWGDVTFQVPGDVKRSCNCDTGVQDSRWWLVTDVWWPVCAWGLGRSGLGFCLTFPEQVCSHSLTKDVCFLPTSFSGSLAFNGNDIQLPLNPLKNSTLILFQTSSILHSFCGCNPSPLQTWFCGFQLAAGSGVAVQMWSLSRNSLRTDVSDLGLWSCLDQRCFRLRGWFKKSLLEWKRKSK